MAFGETENRPDAQWIAQGSPALVQNAFVKEKWPSNQRFNFFVAKCKDKTKPCNILEAKYVWCVVYNACSIRRRNRRRRRGGDGTRDGDGGGEGTGERRGKGNRGGGACPVTRVKG